MNNQEVFNNAWQAFVVEKKPKSHDKGLCLYRDPCGNKCAIGVSIPDELYHQDFEEIPIKDLVTSLPEVFSNCNIMFLSELQNCHDYTHNTGNKDDYTFHKIIEERLRDLADYWHLEIP